MVVGIEYCDPERRQGLDQFTLRPGHTFDATDEAGVRLAHAGHHTDRRSADATEIVDLAETAHTHFEHEDLGVDRCVQDRDRKTLLVVEALLARGHPTFAGQ